jgi:uncharacterized protein YecT (DUF1311 family)
MKTLLAAALALPLLAAIAADQPQDWSQVQDEYSKDFAESKAICRRLIRLDLPAADRPDAAAARALKGCDSESLYYGTAARPADPVKARQCGYLELADEDNAGVFGGRTMLMTVYANGRGARRDLDLATHLACQIDGAPFERDGRVRHLAELKAKGWTGSDFDYCDDITSGLAMGYCADRDARKADDARETKIGRIASALAPAQRPAFDALRKAHAAFVDAHGEGEVDLNGTARAAMQIGAEQKLKDELLDLLQRLAAGRAPSFSRAQFAAADARLNAAYRKRLSAIEPSDSPGAVTKAGVVGAQRAWLRYRDAFLAFAAAAYPKVSRDSLAAWLTDERTAMLSAEE